MVLNEEKSAKLRVARATLLSSAPLALAACGSSDEDEVSLFDIPDSYALAMRGNGTTISATALGLGPEYSVALSSEPTNGEAFDFQDGTITYTPDTGYTGNDQVQVEVSDGNGNSQIVTVQLDIGAAGGAPIAADDKFRVAEDGQFSIIGKYGVLANDFDETDLTASLLTAPGNGSVTLNADGSYTYTPAPDFNGQDSFIYTVTDEDGETDTGTVNILVTPVNDAPVAVDYFGSGINWDQVATGQVQAIDIDGDVLTFTLDQLPSNGSVVMYSNGNFEYRPEQYFFGTDSFTYTVSDGNGGTDTATVTVQIAPAIDPIFGFRIDGKNAFDFIGGGLAALGDVNGDNIDDFAISADLTDPLGRTNAGEVYVIYGVSSDFDRVFDLTTLDGTNGFTVYGGQNNDRLGAVTGAGDINDDGQADVILGARFSDTPNGADAGDVYILYGRPGGTTTFPNAVDLTNTANYTTPNPYVSYLIGPAGTPFAPSAGEMGTAVTGIGDFNNDGVDDFLMTMPGFDPSGVNGLFPESGGAHIVLGNAILNATTPTFQLATPSLGPLVIYELHGIDADDRLGEEAAGIGDFNGDGFDDFVLVAPGGDGPGNTGFDNGELHVIFGGSLPSIGTYTVGTMTSAQSFEITTTDIFSFLGSAVSGAGDVNGDGLDDILIGHYLTDGSTPLSGAAHVIYGTTTPITAPLDVATLNGTNGFTINGATTGDQVGFDLANAGDVNGDGFDDLLISAHSLSGTGGTGAAYLVFGQAGGFGSDINLSDIDGTNGYILRGDVPGYFVGQYLEAAGDINNDGFDDIMLSSLGADHGANNSGSVYVMYGGDADYFEFFDYLSGGIDGTLDLGLLANPPVA